MPYNVIYAPSAEMLAASASGASATTAAADQQFRYDQLGEQQRQFDYAQMLRAEQIGLNDANARRSMALQANQFAQNNALQYNRLNADYMLTQQQMAERAAYQQAEFEAQQQYAEQQTVAAFAREHGAAMRQRQDQNFKSFTTQLDAIQEAWRRGEIDDNQLQAAYSQLEQQSGFPVWLPDEMSRREMFQAQQEELQQYQNRISAAFSGVLQDGESAPDPSSFMVEGKDGRPVFSNDLMWSEVQDRRENARISGDKQAELQIKQQQALADQQMADQKQQQAALDKVVASAHKGAAKYGADVAKWEAEHAVWQAQKSRAAYRPETLENGAPNPMYEPFDKPEPVKPQPGFYSDIPFFSTPDDPMLRMLPKGTPVRTPTGIRYVQ